MKGSRIRDYTENGPESLIRRIKGFHGKGRNHGLIGLKDYTEKDYTEIKHYRKKIRVIRVIPEIRDSSSVFVEALNKMFES